jgi:S1-C subfamily serine protease
LSQDGYILTNYHVIEDAAKLQVVASGGEYEAKVVGTDASSDLAVIKIDATGLTPIEIGSSSNLVTGEWVMALGSPFGLEQSVSTGIVSATSRSSSSLYSSESEAIYTNMIQTDAAINPGNSGGALVDKNGKLIGINTIIASTSGSSSGVGFAIPVDYAMNIAQQIIEGKTPTHAQLGVSLTTINSQLQSRYNLAVSEGAYISKVSSGSGAEKAGLEEGDIVVKAGDTKITSASDLIIAVRSHNPGDTITLTYNRSGTEQTATVTLGSDS